MGAYEEGSWRRSTDSVVCPKPRRVDLRFPFNHGVEMGNAGARSEILGIILLKWTFKIEAVGSPSHPTSSEFSESRVNPGRRKLDALCLLVELHLRDHPGGEFRGGGRLAGEEREREVMLKRYLVTETAHHHPFSLGHRRPGHPTLLSRMPILLMRR